MNNARDVVKIDVEVAARTLRRRRPAAWTRPCGILQQMGLQEGGAVEVEVEVEGEVEVEVEGV